jgi:hypothetical protein
MLKASRILETLNLETLKPAKPQLVMVFLSFRVLMFLC